MSVENAIGKIKSNRLVEFLEKFTKVPFASSPLGTIITLLSTVTNIELNI